MEPLNPLLSFNGNCEEAMKFYQKCFGGELNFQFMDLSIHPEMRPLSMNNLIVYAVLSNDKFTLSGSDLTDYENLATGNSVSFIVYCKSEKEMKKYFQCLSDGAISIIHAKMSRDGALISNLTDKYCINWILHFNPLQTIQ